MDANKARERDGGVVCNPHTLDEAGKHRVIGTRDRMMSSGEDGSVPVRIVGAARELDGTPGCTLDRRLNRAGHACQCAQGRVCPRWWDHGRPRRRLCSAPRLGRTGYTQRCLRRWKRQPGRARSPSWLAVHPSSKFCNRLKARRTRAPTRGLIPQVSAVGAMIHRCYRVVRNTQHDSTGI
jgi:hypothetical protein